MGLLDMNFDDPQSAGILGLATGLLSAGGPSLRPVSLGQAMAAGMQGMQVNRKAALDQQREAMQMDMLKQQIAAATRKNNLINDMLSQYAGQGGQASAPTDGQPAIPAPQASQFPLGSGFAGMAPPNPGDDQPAIAPQAPAARAAMLNNVPRQAIAHDLAFNDGKNIGEWMYKQGVPDMQVSNGYAYDKNRLSEGFLPQLNMSQDGKASMVTIGPDKMPTVTAPRGALDTYGDYRRAEKKTDSQFALLPKDYANKEGRPIGGSQYDYLFPQDLPDSLPPGAKTGLDVSALDPQVAAKLRKADPEAFNRGVADFQRTSSKPVAYGSQRPLGPMQLQSDAEKEEQIGAIKGRQGTQQELNKNWITATLNPVQQAGQNAKTSLASLDALGNIDVKTGWNAEAKANAAAFLTSLGVAPKNAEMFAANAQKFQSVAMSNLLTTFEAQKGPQTEGDAKRVMSTFASLKNTPEANQFMMDFARAKANMDARRAAYYTEALPMAQQEGDLTKVDREWQKVSGSIWADPIMKRWSK